MRNRTEIVRYLLGEKFNKSNNRIFLPGDKNVKFTGTTNKGHTH